MTDAIDPYQPYRSTLLPSQRVRELSRLRPARVVVDVLWCWAWIVAAWVACGVWTTWWVVALAVPVIGTRYYALTVIGHDGFHRRQFNSARTNDLFNDIMILGPIGLVTRINNQNHLRHHRHLASVEDPDRHKHCCFNKTNVGELLGFLTGLTSVLATVRHVLFSKRAEPEPHPGPDPAGPPRDGGAPRHRPRDLLIIGLWQVALIGGLTVGVGWWAWPVLWLLPVYAFTFLGDNLRSFAEHSHPENDAKADHHRLITYVSNPIERRLLAPKNMNYHAAHHLWPSIPYYNLPLADAEMRRQPGAAGLEWRKSYVGYLYRYFLALPLEECRVKLG